MTNLKDEFSRALGRIEGKMDMMTVALQELSQSFANLEKGRLSNLEINFAKLQTETTDKARIVAFVTSIFGSTFGGIVIAITLHFLRI